MHKRELRSILLLLIILSYAKASSTFKVFDTKTAMIDYKIKGNGKLAKNNYLSIDGNATLVFDKWGMHKLYKEKYVATTKGSVENRKIILTLILDDKGEISKVDFKHKKIIKSVNLITKASIKNGENLYEKMKKDMEMKGSNIDTSTVLGYPCEIWLYKGKKRCFYKGIPLREEYTVSGIKVLKEAVSIDLDGNFSKDAFALPNFKEDKKNGFLLKEKRDTHSKNLKKIKEIEKDEMSPNIEIDANNVELDGGEDLTEDIFHKQKRLLPKLLQETEDARVCLQYAQNRVSANNCLAKSIATEEQLSGERNKDSEVTIWTDLAKEKRLDELEFTIMDMKKRMPCIRRSRNFVDLSQCMQNSGEE